MGIKRRFLIVTSFYFYSILLSSCGKNRLGCATASYGFLIGVKAYPSKEIIKLGDTLWFEVNSATSLKDVSTGKIVDYSGSSNLGTAVGFGKVILNDVIASANSFDHKLLIGSEVNNSNTSQIREFLFAQSNNHYVFKLGVIPKEKGVFGVGFSNASNVYRNSDKCTKASFTINFENTPHHYHLNPLTGSDTTNNYGSYYFKVE